MTDEREAEDLPDGDDGEDLRRLFQGLPEVAPPDGFFDDLIRHRRRRARTVVVVGLAAAGVAGAIVVAQATGITGEVNPPMSELADRHDLMMDEAAVAAADDMGADVPAPYQRPAHLGPLLPGMAVRHPDDVVQVVYGEDGHYVSVFEQPGDLEEDELDDATMVPLHLAGVAAWQAEDGSIIVRRADVVYVLIGDLDLDPDELTSIIEDLPDARPMGLTDRIGDAMDDLVDAFGLG